MSFVSVPKKTVKIAATKLLNWMEKEKGDMREFLITDYMKFNLFAFWKKRLTRREAEEKYQRNKEKVGSIESLIERFQLNLKEKAEALLVACEISASDVVFLSLEDVEIVKDWGEKEELNSGR